MIAAAPSVLLGRMKDLTERRFTLERLLKIHYPSLRHGDALWPEYESFSFDEVEHAPYRKVIKDLGTLSRQLHGQTKMESLFKWQAANLHYLVVEPALVDPHEIPLGWGLLVRAGSRLELLLRPEWREIEESTRLLFLHRVAAAGTRATNRQAGIAFDVIENERLGPGASGPLNTKAAAEKSPPRPRCAWQTVSGLELRFHPHLGVGGAALIEIPAAAAVIIEIPLEVPASAQVNVDLLDRREGQTRAAAVFAETQDPAVESAGPAAGLVGSGPSCTTHREFRRRQRSPTAWKP